jgi:hypothetical protein
MASTAARKLFQPKLCPVGHVVVDGLRTRPPSFARAAGLFADVTSATLRAIAPTTKRM